MFYRHLVPVSIILAAVIDPILAQTLPCPPIPQLVGIVDTSEKCSCFYALSASNFDVADSSTFDTVLNDESVQYFAQTGKYVGIDGITEYLQWVEGGKFITSFIPIGPQLILDMTATTKGQCVVTTAERRRMSFNPSYIQDNKEVCIDVLAGNVLSYTMTGNPGAPITIQKISTWLPDELVSVTFPLIGDSTATAEYVCDTIVDTCGYSGSRRRLKSKTKGGKTKDNKSASKAPKKGKDPKQSVAKKECLETYNSLTDFDESGGLTYIDGNTKGCRVIHALMANINSAHCPHISFDAEEDVNGLVKCNKSKQTPLTDIFTEKQLGLFKAANVMLDFGPTGFHVNFEACPTQ